MKKVLFVCTGNTCRSPMAMAIYNKLTGENSTSAGLSAGIPSPAAENAKKAVEKYGATLENHISKQLTHEDIYESDIVITMTKGHKNALTPYFSDEKIVTLGEFAGTDEEIPDPYGGNEKIYDTAAEKIYMLLKKGIENEKTDFAAGNDKARIFELEKETFPDAWSEKIIDDYIKKKRIIIYRESGEILGYCIFMQAADEGEILRIAVKKDSRKKGIGRILLNKTLGILKTSGAENVYLEVRKSNEPAISLYQAAGFENTGMRHGYYKDGEDALLFNLNIKDRL